MTQASSPEVDPKALRQVFGQFCTGVTVVLTQDADGNPYGITVNSFSSVGLDPPLALFCITRDSDTLPALEQSRTFSVNILADTQQDISNRLAKKGGSEKLDGLGLTRRVSGAPALEQSLALLDCEVFAFYDGGDHVIVVGRIVDAEILGPLSSVEGIHTEIDRIGS